MTKGKVSSQTEGKYEKINLIRKIKWSMKTLIKSTGGSACDNLL